MVSSVPNINIVKSLYRWRSDKKIEYRTSRFMLIYLASGMISGGTQGPNGEWLYQNDGEVTDSRFLLVPPGGSFLGDFNQTAQEYALFEFDCDSLHYDSKEQLFTLPLANGKFQHLTPSLSLMTHHVLSLRPGIATAHDRFTHEPFSEGLKLAAEMELCELLTWLFILPRCPHSERCMSPAARFKALIDKDPGWKVPMFEMIKKVGRSPQTLRREFRKEFGISPMLYREQKRRDIAFTYIQTTRLPLKTICARLGMKSPTHLSIYIRRVSGKSPRQMRMEAIAKENHIAVHDKK